MCGTNSKKTLTADITSFHGSDMMRIFQMEEVLDQIPAHWGWKSCAVWRHENGWVLRSGGDALVHPDGFPYEYYPDGELLQSDAELKVGDTLFGIQFDLERLSGAPAPEHACVRCDQPASRFIHGFGSNMYWLCEGCYHRLDRHMSLHSTAVRKALVLIEAFCDPLVEEVGDG